MIKRLLLALIFLTAGTSSARAAELCNQTSFVIQLASGWAVDGGVAIEGWTRIRPGGCAEVATDVDLEGDQPIFYYAKTSAAYPGGVREWRGGIPLCVDEADFEVVANTRCAALGLASRDFMIREGDDRDRTLLVEPANYGSRADDAGLQRLLQAAGYAISSVDGYIGRGTRNAMNAFISDQELGSRPSDNRLMDLLEAQALERNARSGLLVCNESSTDIAAALANRVDDIWQSRGWWRLHNGECARLVATRLETSNSFYYAERINAGERRAINDGEDAFCYAPSRFVAEGRINCADRGYATARFRRIPDPEDGGVRVDIRDVDFERTGQ
jgi:uncharacterized membrane protein